MTRSALSSLLAALLLSACRPDPGPGPGPDPDPDPEPDLAEIPNIAPQPTELHGMLLFGEQSTFISHLPLYASPHNFQILLRLEMQAEGGIDPQAEYIQDRQQSGEVLYTLIPSDFAISDLADALRAGQPFPIRGIIVRGHFERGGTPILGGQDFPMTISAAMHFRQLNAGEADPAEGRYLLFGEGDEAFLVHKIAGRPDFDHVVSVTGADDLLLLGAGDEIALDGLGGDRDPVLEGQVITGQDLTRDLPVSLTVGTEFYIEFNELSF
jgi:hypothetical protein